MRCIINLSIANPGLLIFLIYLPIFLFCLDKTFRKKFCKVNSKNPFLDLLAGLVYFLIIFYAATLSFSESAFSLFSGLAVYLIFTLITFWSYHIFLTSKEKIIREGPYNFSRNPTYFFAFLAIVGIVIATTSQFLFALLFLQFIITHKIIVQEEKSLKKEYKKEFIDYSRKVSRYF